MRLLDQSFPLRLSHGDDAHRPQRISRFTANGDTAIAGSELVILELDNLSGATNHNGGALPFGPMASCTLPLARTRTARTRRC